MKVAVRIQAHPSRTHLHAALAEAMAPLPVEISIHESDPPNPLRGYLQALTDPPDCSHLVVIQDDVEVCKNFPLAVTRIAEARSAVPICLFLARLPLAESAAALRALKGKNPYIRARPRSNSFVPVVAILWPIEKAEHFREWCKTAKLPGYPRHDPASDDAAVAHWMLKNKEEILISVPSLVEHPDREPSLIGRRAKWGKDRGRVAVAYIGDGDPLDLDWS